jgi:PadR family transcriptional regulator PadR
MERESREPLDREILIAFWKIHILHHAESRPVYGLWLVHELAEHGYRLNPGTLYPVIDRMERNGWLRSKRADSRHPKSRRLFRITPAGRLVLKRLRTFVAELHDEVVLEAARGQRPARASRHDR